MRKGQLKPKLVPVACPFCGKKPKLAPQDPSIEGNAWGEVYCANRRCPAQPAVRDGSQIADMRGSGAYIDLAIKRWNRRATVNKAFVDDCLKNPDDHVLCVATVHGITAHGAGGESS